MAFVSVFCIRFKPSHSRKRRACGTITTIKNDSGGLNGYRIRGAAAERQTGRIADH